jgi:hypothetical protein
MSKRIRPECRTGKPNPVALARRSHDPAFTPGLGYAVGVWGSSSAPSGCGIYYSGNLAGTGSKSCVVKTSKGPTLMYCQESPENWFEDFGEGRLVDGRCYIELDPVFLETVSIDAANPMKVFIQLRDECEGTCVKTGQTGFDVVELHGGTSSAAFAYRVVAKREGFEARRLDRCEAALNDSYFYPELREKELQEIEAERARMASERAQREQTRKERAQREEGIRARSGPMQAGR